METLANIGNSIAVVVLAIIGLPLGGILAFIGYNYNSHGSFEMYDQDKHGDNDPNRRTGWILMGVGGLILVALILTFIIRIVT